MNPIKKISRLEKKIEGLESEITFLKQTNQDVEQLKNEYVIKLKLAEQRELEYNMAIEQVKKERELYRKALKKLDFIISKVNKNNKKALKEMKNDMNI